MIINLPTFHSGRQVVPKWNWNLIFGKIKPAEPKLLIVPKWNWNIKQELISSEILKLLIVPKWNWNTVLYKPIKSEFDTFNRTKVELKWVTRWINRFNWCNLLIVPKWNWNFGCRCCFVVLSLSFNRTKVELKCGIDFRWPMIVLTFNRTKVELKSGRRNLRSKSLFVF